MTDRAWSVEEALEVMRSWAQSPGCMFERMAEALERTVRERDEARLEADRLRGRRNGRSARRRRSEERALT